MNRFTRIILNFTIAINILFITACSSNAPVAQNQAGTLSKESVMTVKQGTVTSIKNVTIIGRKGRAAGTVGSIAGSILGSSVPIAGSIIGSLIGGAVGSEADRELSKQKGLEITLQLNSGEKVVVTQLAETLFKAGDNVQLIMKDNQARVAHLQSNS
ncbi:MAG: hypothetical protein V7749_10545 [Cocleimonas sp.]